MSGIFERFRRQLPPRGTGLVTGTARPRPGRGVPLTDIERAGRHTAIYGQDSMLPALDAFRTCMSEGGTMIDCLQSAMTNRRKLL